MFVPQRGPACIITSRLCLDTDRRELRRGDDLVAVEPQVFDLLEYLIRCRERVITKDDLMAAIWHGRVVSESALTTRINSVRTAIGDNGDSQHLIKTLRGKGLRFVRGRCARRCRRPQSDRAAAASLSPRSLSDQPSIAVLPFVNLSGDPEQEYFADGMTEEIITALARFKSDS